MNPGMVLHGVADLATARADLPGAGTGTLALAISGATAPATQTAVTEEWTVPSSVNNLTVASS